MDTDTGQTFHQPFRKRLWANPRSFAKLKRSIHPCSSVSIRGRNQFSKRASLGGLAFGEGGSEEHVGRRLLPCGEPQVAKHLRPFQHLAGDEVVAFLRQFLPAGKLSRLLQSI